MALAWADRSPAPARAAAEFAFDEFKRAKHCARVDVAFDQHNGIGEIASGAAMRWVEDDRRRVEQAKVGIEACDCCLDHLGWPAKAAVAAVRPECDGVKVDQALVPFPALTLSLSKGGTAVPERSRFDKLSVSAKGEK